MTKKTQIRWVCFIKNEGFYFFMSSSVQFFQGGFVKILDYSGAQHLRFRRRNGEAASAVCFVW